MPFDPKRKYFPIKLALLVSPIFLAILLVGKFYIVKINQSYFEKEKRTFQVLVRTGAVRLSEFFGFTERDLIMLAETSVIKSGPEAEARERMAMLFQNYQKKNIPVGAFFRTNEEGTVVWSANAFEDRTGEGDFLGDRDYFVWAKGQKSPGLTFTNKPIISRGGALKGKTILVKATPLFNKNKFDGILAMVYPTEDLISQFLAPLGFDPQIKILLVTEEGIVIGKENLGSLDNLLDSVDKNGDRSLLGQLHEQSLEKEGSFLFEPHLGSVLGEGNRLVSYHPVTDVGDRNWALWFSVPIAGITRELSSIKTFYYSEFVIILALSLVLLMVLLAVIRFEEKKSFINGYHNGRKHLSKQS